MMGFIDSYKRLEKLCSEIYNNNRGVSYYIDEMINTPVGARYVPGWNEDLKRLKHYRWVRNRIAHEPECNEGNMCEPGDAEWLNNFHSRIMAVNDPLAQYRKLRNPQPAQVFPQTHTPEQGCHTYPQHTSAPQRSAGCLSYVIGALVVVVAVSLIVAALV